MGKRQLTDTQRIEYTRVAYYYYKESATQEEIAKRMKMSRQRVNRILNACLSEGIVEITVNNLDKVYLELEGRIKEKYSLYDIRIVHNTAEEDIYLDLGQAAGNYLASILQDGDVIGFGRGRTLAAMAEHMPIVHTKRLTAVQLMGSRNQEPQNTAVNDIVHNFSRRLGAKYAMLFAPIVVSSPDLKQSLRQDPIFQESYQYIRRCNIGVVGIGTHKSAGFMAKLLGIESTEQLIDPAPGQHLTGEVVTHLYDQNGKPVPNNYQDQVIGIEYKDWLQIPVRIGVAGLPQKARAIHAAAKGKYINALIVDLNTARIMETL